jgi:ankyrin repeat protein
LLAAGADIKILDRTGSNIVLTAAQHGCASSLAALVLDRDTVVTTSNNRTATSFSIRGNKGMCFLNAGLKVSIKREDSNEVIEQEDRNCTPLLESASRHHTECVAVLLAAGAKMEQSDSNGRTPLILAAAGGFDDIVSLLLMKKASVNHVDLSGATALFHAVCVLSLDFHASDCVYSFFSYVCQCSKKHVSCIELLLRHGCDINIADASHRRPVDLIVKHKMVEVLTKLVNAGAEIKQVCLLCIMFQFSTSISFCENHYSIGNLFTLTSMFENCYI